MMYTLTLYVQGLALAGRDLKQASTKDLATSFVERAGKLVFF
jgi:hypothetical protein